MNRLGWLAGATLAAAALLSGIAYGAGGTVNVAYAGSLVAAFENSIGPAFAKRGYEYRGEGKGSVALANLIKDGLRTPDVFVSADTKVLDDLMKPGGAVKWYVPFGSARLVIAYSPSSPFAHSFVEAGRGKRSIADVLEQPGLRLGRTDPALDPKGYRTIVAMRLLEKATQTPGLAQKVLGEDRNAAQIFPEETLEARLESGDLDAAFMYSVETPPKKLPAIELPPQANMGDLNRADEYASESVTINGVKHPGSPIVYALTVPTVARNPEGGAAFIAFLSSTDGRALLERAGLKVGLGPVVGDRAAVPASLSDVIPLQ